MTDVIVTPIPFTDYHHRTLMKRLIAIEASAKRLRVDRSPGVNTVTIITDVPVDGAIQTSLSDAVAAHNDSAMATDKATITADDTDTATITMTDAAIQNLENVDYEVYGNGSLDFSGSVVASAGSAQYLFKTGLAASYLIIMKRQNADESGIINVTATGV